MNGNKLLADTNIIIYLLDGDRTVAGLLNEKTVHVSFVSQLELLSYSKLSAQDEVRINDFLEQCIIVDINPSIKEEVIRIRKQHPLKLPDSIIVASALYLDIPLITSDQDLQKVEELSLVYYQK
ncbi:type II toxin-antitoxin system VapC family toxin [Tunicatimonas pelagia]|uniref:type II toxin-antitoxin system VapC family toxin n=1 Tax=Tunicatimonas pelagia TaxID=931531 RepID=UPI002665358C|nr:type II toxin-antitoxin system VapC family toxin [Tunicatimonas pelagia]WKN42870.1 type II toxin-antitoxin system VapC family toxin [Tunicatimonas pelagia]